eukprot:TRINITY_DN57062_c0_g1_i1.p1 TRINITY_DN57062_c0_g1~~TRINITY_DN57062_c0_g1_i1.p1  ORF type:complete len:194 (+),score=17.43 TRINITY_DN57062_c0_g1_i1:162-743(+)
MAPVNPVTHDRNWRRTIEQENRISGLTGWNKPHFVPAPGQRLRLSGLITRWELNGEEGELVSSKTDQFGRLTVRVPARQRSYLLDPRRLEPALEQLPGMSAGLSAPNVPAVTMSPLVAQRRNARSSCPSRVSSAPCLPCLGADARVPSTLSTCSSEQECYAPGSCGHICLESRKGFTGGRGGSRKKDGGFFTS